MKRMDELREESGTITYSDPLTAFLYDLMRDHLPAGVVEKMVFDVVSYADECTFTNGWLAKYAHNLAERINNSKADHLKKAVEGLFEAEELKRKEEVVKKAKQSCGEVMLDDVPETTIEDEILADLNKKIADLAESEQQEEDCEDIEDELDGIEEAKEMVKQLKEEGHIATEDADRLQNELDEVKDELDGEKKCCGECNCGNKGTLVIENELPKPDKAEETEIEIKEEDKLSSEEAKRVVDAAVDLDVVTNTEWCKKNVTYIDVPEKDEEKWKNTNEELQKIEEETTDKED